MGATDFGIGLERQFLGRHDEPQSGHPPEEGVEDGLQFEPGGAGPGTDAARIRRPGDRGPGVQLQFIRVGKDFRAPSERLVSSPAAGPTPVMRVAG